ncbi:hypothetical protein A2V82_01385 [candidate division KSB1 bacterium RBG_16_48_16]|nr:MAG: hypothetical protein A2V82_01385 [candidate division KSB1 bacterium RBG_16_48_16]
MQVFQKAILKKYWPAVDKGEEDQMIHQVVLNIEVDLDNSHQVAELFNNMVRGLVQLSFIDNLTGEEYVLPAVTIKPFNVKQRKVKIGKGDESETVKTEYASLQIVSRVEQETGGAVLADLYGFFNIELQMTIDRFKEFDTMPSDQEPFENNDESKDVE